MSATEPILAPDAPSDVRRTVLAALRGLRLLSVADAIRRLTLSRRDAADNAAFLAENPDFVAPPIAYVYEVTGRVSLRAFARDGKAACEALTALLDAHGPPSPARRVLDWGAGPARVARWWPVLRPGVEIHAGDPWAEAMDWGARALPAVRFHRLPALPPTELAAESFDLVYGISILTHLSLPAQRAWLLELARLLRPGGLLALTLQGRRALSRLSPAERARWEAGEPVQRARVREGSRLFLAYHPPGFLREDLFKDWRIVLHEPDSIVGAGGQDLWLLRREPSD
jgi:SAM-dependent methyltransferase